MTTRDDVIEAARKSFLGYRYRVEEGVRLSTGEVGCALKLFRGDTPTFSWNSEVRRYEAPTLDALLAKISAD